MTKTASVDECPGKCIHALASLLCDGVLETVTCPTKNMRCCVDKRNKNKIKNGGANIPENNEVKAPSTKAPTVKKVKKKVVKEQVGPFDKTIPTKY